MIRNLWSKVTISIFFYLLHVQPSQSHDMRLDVIFTIIIGQLIYQRLIFIQFYQSRRIYRIFANTIILYHIKNELYYFIIQLKKVSIVCV